MNPSDNFETEEAPAGTLSRAEAYRIARSTEHPIFADAPVFEMQPMDREWVMISLTDLQTAVALGRKDG